MATTKYRGDDIDITITLKDSNGVAIDLTTLAGYIVHIRDNKGKVYGRFSKNAYTDSDGNVYSLTTDVSDPDGQFKCKWQSAQTSVAPASMYDIEVKEQVTDAGYTNSTFHTIGVSVDAIDLLDASTKSEGDIS